MADIQQLMNAVLNAMRVERSDYHLTLGELRNALASVPSDALVVTDRGGGLGGEMSYRGYYDDLAFAPSETSTAGDVLAACDRALAQAYEGYKGGNYRYGNDTPLWLAHYGCCGSAMIGATLIEGRVLILTKDVD